MNADANIDSICVIRDGLNFKIFLYQEARPQFIAGNVTKKTIEKLLANLNNLVSENEEISATRKSSSRTKNLDKLND